MLFAYTSNRTDHALPNFARRLFRHWSFTVLAASATLCATPSMAIESSNLSSASAVYQRDRAMCNSGQTNQDRATCLKEAGAAYDETRRKQLTDDKSQYEKNAMARCNALPADELEACQRRIAGEGVSEGSVEEGGIYRKIEMPDVAPRNRQNYQNNY